MNKRKIACAVAAAVISLTLCGCVPHVELNEKAIVEAVGIDAEGGKYKVTLQYFNTEGSGSSALVDVSKPNVITVYGVGDTVVEALNDASLSCGRQLMFGINQLVLIGREATNDDLSDLLSFAKTYYQCHPKIKITAVDGKASDVLAIKYKEGASSPLNLSYVLRNSVTQGVMFNSTLITTMEDLKSETASAVLPLVTITEGVTDATEDGKSVLVNGAVLYREGTALADISPPEVSGLMLLDNEMQEISLNTEIDGKSVSLTLYGIRTSIDAALSAEGLTFAVKTKAAAEITDNQFDEGSPEEYLLAEQAAAEQVVRTMRLAAENVIKKYGTDVINLEGTVRSRSNDNWQLLRETWSQALKESRWVFEADVSVERYGIYME